MQSQSFGKHSLGKFWIDARWPQEVWNIHGPQSRQFSHSALPRIKSYLRNFNRCIVSSTAARQTRNWCSNQTQPSREVWWPKGSKSSDSLSIKKRQKAWLLAIKLSIGREESFSAGLWFRCHHSPLLRQSRDASFMQRQRTIRQKCKWI